MKTLRHNRVQVAEEIDTEKIQSTTESKVYADTPMHRSDDIPVLDVKQEFHEEIDAIPTWWAIVNGLPGLSGDPA